MSSNAIVMPSNAIEMSSNAIDYRSNLLYQGFQRKVISVVYT
jgi:hypothetical protein